MMNPYRCYYHPDIEAVTKCERCGKYLCLECKQVYHQRVGDPDHMGVVRRDLCQDCRDKTVMFNYIFMIVIVFIFIIVASAMWQNFQNSIPSNDPFFP